MTFLLTSIVSGAGLSMEYLIPDNFFAASESSVGGVYLGAIVVGMVKRTAFSSTGSSLTYLITTDAELPGFKCPT